MPKFGIAASSASDFEVTGFNLRNLATAGGAVWVTDFGGRIGHVTPYGDVETFEVPGDAGELLQHAVHVTVPAGVRNGARFYFTVTPRHNRSTRIELHVAVAAGR